MKTNTPTPCVSHERAPKIHELKTWPEYYRAVQSGSKRFEVRKNDRDFREGDLVVLKWFDPDVSVYNGEKLTFQIGYILNLSKYLETEGKFVCFSLLDVL